MYAPHVSTISPSLPSPEISLTDVVCWSRMQAESGEHLKAIIARKDLERSACNGLFFWGVGNAPARDSIVFSHAEKSIDVIFSIMKSRPKRADTDPGSLIIWRRFIDSNGSTHPLPAGALVTSRGTTAGGEKHRHYALVCSSDVPLELGDYGPFNPSAYRNVGGKRAPVGSSQVTALLQRYSVEDGRTADYRINLRARLAGSYWVRLCDPLVLDERLRADFTSRLASVAGMSIVEWCALVRGVCVGPSRSPRLDHRQAQLF